MALEKLNQETFEEKVMQGSGKCIVVFSRKNCRVCKEVVPMLEELEPELHDVCAFYAVDVEEEAPLYQRFPLKGVPSVMFFSGGDYQGKMAGPVSEDMVREKIAEL
ncbi:MAG: thioredoxin family protein [Gracilibacteraceae bacterium]|jgi:thioredoxin 1|nr:thioredoxin family protein [Gracilibacteraceae bacterium]